MHRRFFLSAAPCLVLAGVALMNLDLQAPRLRLLPEQNRLSVHPLPRGEDCYEIDMIWRKQAVALPMIQALIQALRPADAPL